VRKLHAIALPGCAAGSEIAFAYDLFFTRAKTAIMMLSPEDMDLIFHNARAIFAGEEKKAHAETTAFRNGSMQGAYFIIAARAIGLDCGPMSGFNNAKVDAEFFAGTGIKSNFLCNLGYGDASKVMPRSPRPAFDEVCTLL